MGLDIALTIAMPYVVGSSFGSSILESTPASCICYVTIVPTESYVSLKGSWIYGLVVVDVPGIHNGQNEIGIFMGSRRATLT